MAEQRRSPPDQPHRDEIANQLDCTMLVEAAAGTGKTTCLIHRMVNLIRSGTCRVETMAAVTFTRKAAAELRTRLQLALETEAARATGQQHERLATALHGVERCFVGTIHAFCARLLRERPVEADVDPGFVELDEDLDAQLRRQAWQLHVAQLIAGDDPILPELERLGLKISPATRRSHTLATELDELGLELAELGPAFMQYAEFTDVQQWPADPVPMPDLTACRQQLRQYAEHMRSLELPVDPGNDRLMPLYQRIGRMCLRLDLDQPAQLMEVLEHFQEFERKKLVQRNWPGQSKQALAELARWNQFTQTHATALVLVWREHRYEPVMRALRPALDIYNRLRRDRNALNFQDLLIQAAELLRDKPEVRTYFRDRFTHVLVDEFQDTDPLQAEVMLLLTADDCRQTDWQACCPVPGSLFVVGDPKQSIYRFRRADIVTYNKVLQIVEAAGGKVVPLTANFRSVPDVIQWVNDCFDRLFPAVADDTSPANRRLECGRDDQVTDRPAVHRIVAPDGLGRREQVAEHEAELIARTIRTAIDQHWPVPRTPRQLAQGLPRHAVPGDFMIVARNKKYLTRYARKLQQHGVPHAVTGGSVLNEVPELRLLYLCLSAITRSDDPIAFVAVLRSELFGVADPVLYQFRRLGGRFHYYAPIPQGLPAGDAEQLQQAMQRLQTYHRWLQSMPPIAAIERIAADLGLPARACAAAQGDTHAGSLLKTLEVLRATNQKPMTAEDWMDTLARLVDQTEPHDGVSVRPAAHPGVRVMNLHQCKGLEAAFVFLVDPGGELDRPVEVVIDRSGPLPTGYLPIYGLQRGKYERRPLLAQPRDWSHWEQREAAFLDAETRRLLYVAATRAGVQLAISQRRGRANDRNPWQLYATRLASVPELADPGPVTDPPPANLAWKAADWQRKVEQINQRWAAVTAPSYFVQAVKQAAMATQRAAKPRSTQERGAQWGNVLHTLLETCMKQPTAPLRGLALSLLESEQLPLTLVDEVLNVVSEVTESALWQRARDASDCYTEVPVARPLAADASSGIMLPTVERGVIDLVFQEPDGWVVVDYKSERVEAADLPALVAYYRPQLDAYAQLWQHVSQQTVKERGLFFTHFGQYEVL